MPRHYHGFYGRHREPELTGHTRQILAWLAEQPRTTDELTKLLHMTAQSIARRVAHLKKHGLVCTPEAAHTLTEKAFNLMRGDIS